MNGIAKRVTDIPQNEDLGVEMRRKGKGRVERDFTWKAVMDRINSVYRETDESLTGRYSR